MNFIIPISLISVSSLAIILMVWRKFPQLKRLTLENSHGSFWNNFFPEVDLFLRRINFTQYKAKFFDEVEKGLRFVRVASLKVDNATNTMIHKVKKNGSNGSGHKDEEIEGIVEIQRNFQDEEDKLITAISEEPKNPVLYKKLGDLYIDMDNFEDAIEALKVSVELNPEDKEAREKLKNTKATLAQR